MRIRTHLRRSAFAASALLLAVALVGPSLVAIAQTGGQSDDPDADRPGVWDASTFTAGVEVSLNTDPPQAVAEILHLDVPLGRGTFTSGLRSTSRAASLWPGLLFATGANLVWGQACAGGFPCEQFPGFPPDWPFAAEASYPTDVDVEATTSGERVGEPGGPLSMTLHVVEAHAGRDFVSSEAVVEDLDLLPLDDGSSAGAAPALGEARPAQEAVNPSLLHVGSLTSITREEFQGDTLVAFAESRLADVSLLAGAVRIEELVVRSTSRHDGSEARSEPEVTVEGVTLGGQPAEITERGLEVDGEPVDEGTLNALTDGVAGAFTNTPTPIRLVDTTEDGDDTTTSGDAVGVFVDYRVDASNFPGGTAAVGTLVLGTASSQARVLGEDSGSDLDFDLDVDPGAGAGDGVGGGATGDGGGFDDATVADSGTGGTGGGSAGVAAPSGEPGQPVASGGAVEHAGSQPQRVALEVLADLAARRMELLYGAWALALLGLALGSRLRPLRLTSASAR